MAYGKNTEKIILSDPEYFVELNPRLNWGQIRTMNGENPQEVEEMLATCIKAWNIEGDDGATLEITPKAMNVLLTEDLTTIVTRINEANSIKKADAAEDRAFLDTSVPGSSDVAQTPQAA